MSQGAGGVQRRGDRLQAFATEAEERWLAGTGPAPVSPAGRLPDRAPVLLPRAGIGRWVAVARRARAWVDGDGALWLRGADGPDRVLVPPGRARAGWWLVDRGPAGARLPPVDAGWFVISGTDGPLAALRLAEWLPGWRGERVDARLVRAAGAEAVCQTLGVAFEAVGDPDEAGRRVGTVPLGARLELDQGLDGRGTAVLLGFAALVLAGLSLFIAHQPAASLVVLAIGLVSPVAADLAAWWLRRRRTRRLPRHLGAWWRASPDGHAVPGRGMGLRTGPGGQELVVPDGHGSECWLAGPACGGAAGLVAVSAEAGRAPWALLLYDRTERLLAGLPGRDWVGGAAATGELAAPAMKELAAAARGLGLELSAATEAPQPMMPSRERAKASRTPATDGWPSLTGTALSAAVSIPLAVVCLLKEPRAVAAGATGWAIALIATRILLRRRTVL